MSFALTERQIRDRTKTVTRRLGWKFLKAGTEVNAVNKCMGFKKGEKPIRLATIRVISVRQEPLGSITYADVRAEGFEGKDPHWFVEHFCKSMKCSPLTMVTRIEFEYVTTNEN